VNKITEPKWYHTAWVIGISFVFFPPLGVILSVFSSEVRGITKAIIVLVFMAIATFIGGMEYSYGFIDTFYVEFIGGTCLEAGNSLARKGHYRDALKIFKMSVLVKPMDAELWLDYGRCEKALHNSSDALHCFVMARQLADEYDYDGKHRYSFQKASATIQIADILIEDGRVKLSERYIARLHDDTDQRFNSYTSYNLLKVKLAISRENYLQAEGELRTLISQFETAYFGDVYQVYASLETRRGNFSKALYYLCEALRYKEGNLTLESKIMEAAQKVLPDGSQVGNLVPLRSYIRMMRGRRSELGAKNVARVMSQIRTSFPNFEYNDGCLYVEGYVRVKFLDEKLQAARLFEKIVSDYPNSQSYGKALWEASRCYEKLGLREHRKKCLRKIVADLDEYSYLKGEAQLALKEMNKEDIELNSADSFKEG
jgi:tetratricopeptide (TPR) repeat protein